VKKPRHFTDKKAAKIAGKKGGKSVPPSLRYFSVNREAAAAAGRKSRYVTPKPKPKPDDTLGRALFEGIPGDYPKLMPWTKLSEPARQFWRKQADVLLKNGIDPTTKIDLLWDTGDLGEGA
jgi:hypothetical protein